ncbi:ATP-dependent RNA helicase Ddx1, partial [Tetrabaena socialis]
AFAIPVLQIVHEALRGRTRSGADASTSGRAAAAAGGGGGGPASSPAAGVRLSSEDRDLAAAVSADGLSAQSRSEKSWGGVRATVGVLASCGGKVYYEVTVNDEGLSRVGWSAATASLDLGTDRGGFGFGGTGKKSNSRQFDAYGQP